MCNLLFEVAAEFVADLDIDADRVVFGWVNLGHRLGLSLTWFVLSWHGLGNGAGLVEWNWSGVYKGLGKVCGRGLLGLKKNLVPPPPWYSAEFGSNWANHSWLEFGSGFCGVYCSTGSSRFSILFFLDILLGIIILGLREVG